MDNCTVGSIVMEVSMTSKRSPSFYRNGGLLLYGVYWKSMMQEYVVYKENPSMDLALNSMLAAATFYEDLAAEEGKNSKEVKGFLKFARQHIREHIKSVTGSYPKKLKNIAR